MKIAVVFLIAAVYGVSSAFLPSLNTISDRFQTGISTKHHISDAAIKITDSTQKGIAEISKDAAQKTEMVAENLMDIGGDKTKAVLQLGQDKANEMLNAVSAIGGPVASLASIGSKLTNFTSQAAQTLTNANVGVGQLVAAEVNEGVETSINAASNVASAVANKLEKANDLGKNVASSAVDLSVQLASNVGNKFAKGFISIGNAIGNWAKLSPTKENIQA